MRFSHNLLADRESRTNILYQGLSCALCPPKLNCAARISRPQLRDNLLGTWLSSPLAEPVRVGKILYNPVSSACWTFFSSANCQRLSEQQVPPHPTLYIRLYTPHSFSIRSTHFTMKASTILAVLATAVLSNASPVPEEHQANGGYSPAGALPPPSGPPNGPPIGGGVPAAGGYASGGEY